MAGRHLTDVEEKKRVKHEERKIRIKLEVGVGNL